MVKSDGFDICDGFDTYLAHAAWQEKVSVDPAYPADVLFLRHMFISDGSEDRFFATLRNLSDHRFIVCDPGCGAFNLPRE